MTSTPAKRLLVVEFTKMNGAGNDFIVIDNRFYHFSDEELSNLAVQLCPRRTGIGADGILAFNLPREKTHQFRMRYVNADGSIGTMCGNGARCLARFVRQAGVDEDSMVFETDAGVFQADVPEEETAPVRLYLAPPRHFTPNLKLSKTSSDGLDEVHYIWTGTEHVVSFVDGLQSVPVTEWGRKIRMDQALRPTGANVNFVQINGGRLRARTFEKGVEAETLACGTGAVAIAATARLLGRTDQDVVEVEMPGGVLTVGLSMKGGEIEGLYLEGPTQNVFRGTVEV